MIDTREVADDTGSPARGAGAKVAGIRQSWLGLGSRLALRLLLLVGGANACFLYWLQQNPVLLADAAEVFEKALWLLGLNLGLTLFAGYLMGRQLSGRIKQVSELLERTQRGDYQGRLKPGGRDEVGILSRRANLLSSSAEVREKRIKETALTDGLTGLPNRTLLTNRLNQTIKVAERERRDFTVALVDLDRFKWVNDTLGHDAGDVLLIEVARRLKATVRTSDTVARLGGDEFVLLMGGGKGAAEAVVQHVIEAMKAPARFQSQSIEIGLSIGIAVFPQHGKDSLALMRHADAAMYKAKRRNSSAKATEAEPRVERAPPVAASLLSEMRTGLAKGQFLLEYQPKLNLQTGLIESLEALLRWDHPERGRIQPADFIPLAEQTGFMRELTDWVLMEGARFGVRLAREKLDLSVSVNLSTYDMESEGLGESIERVLASTKLDPKRLTVEVAENDVISETENAQNNIRTIGRLGIGLTVDEYGSGFASLRQLENLPATELKISRSLVSGMYQDRGDPKAVKAIVELAKALNLTVVAAGVEAVEDLRLLAQMGCAQAQGYYLSRSLPDTEVIAWIQMRHSLHENSREEYFRMLISPGTPEVADTAGNVRR